MSCAVTSRRPSAKRDQTIRCNTIHGLSHLAQASLEPKKICNDAYFQNSDQGKALHHPPAFHTCSHVGVTAICWSVEGSVCQVPHGSRSPNIALQRRQVCHLQNNKEQIHLHICVHICLYIHIYRFLFVYYRYKQLDTHKLQTCMLTDRV